MSSEVICVYVYVYEFVCGGLELCVYISEVCLVSSD